jgi:hypothetical protein
MSDKNKANPSEPTPKPEELTPEELEQIAGGIKGESQESNHKDWIS